MALNSAAPHLEWWAEKLSARNISPLTRDYPQLTSGDSSRRAIEGVESLNTSPATQLAMRNLSAGRTPQTILLTALVILVSRLTGDDDISVGANARKDGPAFVLRVPINPSDIFTAFAAKVAAQVQEGSRRSTDLFALRVKLDEPVLFRFAAFNAATSGAPAYATIETVDLLLEYLCDNNGNLQLTAHYNQRLFSSARISGILFQLARLIENASENPECAIAALDFPSEQEKKVLPNPTSDLEWSAFRGAIHDIFSANAEAHPDRTCVVETKSRTNPERTFTYQHIHEASNILAHHLVQSGLARGDVVMIYSYRGVDLLVAVMGTLKAGGTFSVLDPLYPPDRQIIYLEVSQPKALVVIDKALKEAGDLHDKVKAYISESLDLKTEVPALHLHDDGTLSGGRKNGQDIFEPVIAQKSKSPGVVVGPDSVPSLSFTSGSEGKPKGVCGRHYSLAFYFDWMARTFHLSANDKFTMLSGIAHDPIQRDMFTPLFLGARLLVPSKDDIQNEKLAEWMRDYGATVTHLTPAMGQILVGGATATFDKLHHSFFVGDILIKRECRFLQSLAPNVSIVNMYGTTETQRAVSYFEIPSVNERPGFLDGMKDVIPAGKGMYNVQLLVVNRTDRSKLCAIGELGEIYVRASGLAEGYLGAPDLSATKFVNNWFEGYEEGIKADLERFEGLKSEPWAEFYKGPRDRLYRSGDLGRYTPTGEVECSGRADDQVKIRGFRIELGEIDTHLSQHPLVRENITLVKKDKFEEPTLVSYIVPQIKAWQTYLQKKGLKDESIGDDDDSVVGRLKRFRLLQQAVQEYLRTKLPAYAVPTIIIPMKAMPLNPNGKIDKPKLPFPDLTTTLVSARGKPSDPAPLTEGERALADIWAKLIPTITAKTIEPDESFFELGANSMTAQQLAYNIRRSLGVDLAINKIYNCPTLREMALTVDRAKALDSLESQHIDDVVTSSNGTREPTGIEYGDDAVRLVEELPAKFLKHRGRNLSSPVVFLTGATGFLGAFILRDLLNRTNPDIRKVIVLVRAENPQRALARLRTTCEAYGVWQESWAARIECYTGTLGPAHFGLSDQKWSRLASEIDVVIHNGAQVHWINTYETLKGPNVLGTIDAVKLCAEGKPKLFAFVSSTSVLDHEYFVLESERSLAAGGEGVGEEDDLMGSRKGLRTGYGQSKWVAEYLIRECGRRGLRGSIIRSGYVLGDSKTGVTNTDDFLIRMLKGCVQLSSRPNINNTVNMVPVDHVARTIVACAFNPAASNEVCVAHVTGHPRLRFNQFLAALQTYGYLAELTDYVTWASALEEYVGTHTDFALMPLFTFVANDLPSNTRAPELDDSNAEESLYADRRWTREDVSGGTGVTKNTVARYLGYLVAIDFLPPPPWNGPDHSVKNLPEIVVSETQREALLEVGGRGAKI